MAGEGLLRERIVQRPKMRVTDPSAVKDGGAAPTCGNDAAGRKGGRGEF